MIRYCMAVLLSAGIICSCNDVQKKKDVAAEPVLPQAPLSDTLTVHVVLKEAKELGIAYLSGILTNESDSVTYMNPVIRFTRTINATGVTEVLAENCQVHIEVAPKTMMTFISSCSIPYNSAGDTAKVTSYSATVKTAEYKR